MNIRNAVAGLLTLALCAGPALSQTPPASVTNGAGVAVPVDPVYCIDNTCSGGGGGGGNPAAGATGSAVPADAGYTGFLSGGNLVGVSSSNPLPVYFPTAQAISAASLPLPTNAAQESGGNLAQVTTDLGAPGATACATDTGSCSTNQQLQRAIQRLTSLISALGSPFQAGGSIGNTTFAVTGTFYQATQPISAASLPLPTGALGAGGNVGGYDFFVSDNPTIQNAAYASGNCMGGFQAVAVARTSGGSGILNKLTLISKGAGTTALQIYVFTTNPSSSTCTDKSTFTIAAADLPKLIDTFSLTPSVPTGGAASVAEQSGMGDHFVTSGNSNLYVAIVSGGAWTPASTSDLIINLGGIQD